MANRVNQALRFLSTKMFWFDGNRNNGMTIGEAFDAFSELRGVDCSGALNGIRFATQEAGDPSDACPLSLTFETINGITYLLLRDAGDNIVFQTSSNIDLNTADAIAAAVGGGGAFADFYGLMPGDNAATVALGGFVDFPSNGPTSGSGIVRTSADQFQLAAIGTYEVSWQVSVDEPGQLVLNLNGAALAETVVGRATGTSQIVGHRLITTTVANSILAVQNPAGNAAALTITPIAGGASAVSASLVIKRIA